jgi:hypothetical protein
VATEPGRSNREAAARPAGAPQAPREPEAIYQRDRQGQERRVARCLDVEVDEASKEIRFGEIYDSDDLLLPEEAEYDRFRFIVKKIAFASRIIKEAPQKGRVLRGVVAEIVGAREQ